MKDITNTSSNKERREFITKANELINRIHLQQNKLETLLKSMNDENKDIPCSKEDKQANTECNKEDKIGDMIEREKRNFKKKMDYYENSFGFIKEKMHELINDKDHESTLEINDDLLKYKRHSNNIDVQAIDPSLDAYSSILTDTHDRQRACKKEKKKENSEFRDGACICIII